MAAATARQLEKLSQKLEPAIYREFMDAVAKITNTTGVELVAELLQEGRIDDVMRLLGVDDARFSRLAESLRAAYVAGAEVGSAAVPPVNLVRLRSATGLLGVKWQQGRRSASLRFRFDMRSERVEEWLRRNSSRLITAIVSDQREVIRRTLDAGVAAGRGPRQTALDIVGRVSSTGRRAGGVVGLTSQQAGFVSRMRAELSDPALMRGYFTRNLRDKRFDRTVRKAMSSGKALSAADIDKIAGRYADRLLKFRADTIARTETLTAVAAAREHSFQQAVDAGALMPEEVECTWSATGDKRTRHSHASMDGQKRKFGEPFRSPSGALMMFPGDYSLGAGAEETIQCRCMKQYRVRRKVE